MEIVELLKTYLIASFLSYGPIVAAMIKESKETKCEDLRTILKLALVIALLPVVNVLVGLSSFWMLFE